MQLSLGKWTTESLDALLRESSSIGDSGERITFISEQFLGVTYCSNTLIGGPGVSEELVVNFEGTDCFTFLDYVESLRLSYSFDELIENLKQVRYRGGEVAYEKRNHFFADWADFNSDLLRDVTEEVGSIRTASTVKILNENEEGMLILPGISPHMRDFEYLPSGKVTQADLRKLRSGDYIGIYTEKAGLDTSHVGIFVVKGGVSSLRHASSRDEVRQVLDEDFMSYISETPGIIILRPRDLQP